MKNRVKRLTEVSKAMAKQSPDEIKIKICGRTDGLVEWDLPNGETELITEAEFKARGGILIKRKSEIDND